MNEGGQSSTGQLIDFMVTTHPAYGKLQALVQETGKNMFEILGERLESMREKKGVATTSKFGFAPCRL
jgi:ribulose kinase